MWYVILGEIFLVIGTAFLFLGSLGIFRMPDVYNRLQAGTKATTLGAFFTIIGVGTVHPQWFFKTLIIALFILITNPVSAHAIGKASLKIGVKMTDRTVVDQSKKGMEGKEEEDE